MSTEEKKEPTGKTAHQVHRIRLAGFVKEEETGKVLKKGGVLVSIVQPPSEEKARSVGARGAMVQSRPDGAKLAEIAKIIDSDRLASVINRILPLSEARRGHELSQSGRAHGKIVLRVWNGNGSTDKNDDRT